MKRILLPVLGAALVTVALIAAPEKAETCTPCDPAECCPEARAELLQLMSVSQRLHLRRRSFFCSGKFGFEESQHLQVTFYVTM